MLDVGRLKPVSPQPIAVTVILPESRSLSEKDVSFISVKQKLGVVGIRYFLLMNK